jgi:hypothetical protein
MLLPMAVHQVSAKAHKVLTLQCCCCAAHKYVAAVSNASAGLSGCAAELSIIGSGTLRLPFDLFALSQRSGAAAYLLAMHARCCNTFSQRQLPTGHYGPSPAHRRQLLPSSASLPVHAACVVNYGKHVFWLVQPNMCYGWANS